MGSKYYRFTVIKMPNKVNTERGQVKVSVVKGLLNLQIPSIYAKQYYDRKQQYLSFGARDTRENMLMAMQASLELQQDLEKGTFDCRDVDKYKHPSKTTNRQYNVASREVDTVLKLYDEFVSNRRIGETTLAGSYKAFRNHIVKMTEEHGFTLKQQLEIKTWIENNVAPIMALEMLALFHRMVEWGKREEKLAPGFDSKFKEYGSTYRRSLRTVNTKRKPPKSAAHLIPSEGIAAWSEQEQDIIIAAFHSRLGSREQAKRNGKPDYSAYLIEFLFLVGCRHGEAFALTWSDVDSDFKRIRINKSYSSKCQIVKGTKTGKVRTIPVNSRAQEMLRILKPDNADTNALVFPNNEGKALNTRKIFALWNPVGKITVIGRLIREEKLTRYLDAYSTRRTFVSLQISKGASVVDVAKWVGDNPETILKHYAGHNEEAVPH